MTKSITGMVLALVIASGARADVVRVAAATSIEHAIDEIAARFEDETGHEVRLVFGSSGTLARQILRGAPFDLFLSADEAFIAPLQDRGLVRGETADYATGHLVLFVPRNSRVDVDGRLEGLVSEARAGRLKRLAIANPEHAPYGAIARQALQNAGVWEALQAYLVIGKDAAQTAQFALTGAVEAALIPASLATVRAVARAGRSIPVSAALYTPLRQPMVVLSGAPEAARALYDFIRGDAGRAVLERHGLGPAMVSAGPPGHGR